MFVLIGEYFNFCAFYIVQNISDLCVSKRSLTL